MSVIMVPGIYAVFVAVSDKVLETKEGIKRFWSLLKALRDAKKISLMGDHDR